MWSETVKVLRKSGKPCGVLVAHEAKATINDVDIPVKLRQTDGAVWIIAQDGRRWLCLRHINYTVTIPLRGQRAIGAMLDDANWFAEPTYNVARCTTGLTPTQIVRRGQHDDRR